MAWWIAVKGSPLELNGPTEVNREAAKAGAIAKSLANPGTVYQVRYHVNANGAAEVHWEASNGQLTAITGDAQKRP
jgi:hypothetical protein